MAQSEQQAPNPRRLRAAQSAAGADAPEKMSAEDVRGLGAVVIRNQFYRDGYRSLLKVALLEAVIIVALIVAIFFVIHTNQPENRYFATTEDGRLVPMVPLNQPNLSSPALMSWVAQSATEVMTFGFNDYRRRLQESSRNFTRRGWESFTQALQRARIIEMVETNQQVVTAAPQGAPILQSEGLVNGRYQWTVQIPMIVTYQSGAKTRSDRLLVTVVVVRTPRLESPNGVGIEQWIAVGG
ncbi:MAG: type IVB secretion system apparatus protein IcmL/DotI [Micavibrio aeruginosavorus]|nr:type IVB secretion system apparatus protein IcmL/DotI [Micavibrio aeruginosavorus]